MRERKWLVDLRAESQERRLHAACRTCWIYPATWCLYRDNGVSLRKRNRSRWISRRAAAAGNEATHAEGTIWNAGFSRALRLVDKGNIIQFDGKSRLLLNGSAEMRRWILVAGLLAGACVRAGPKPST